MGQAPVVGVLGRRAPASVRGAELGVERGEAGRPVFDGVVVEAALEGIFRIDLPKVQESQVAGIDVAFQPLEPVAVPHGLVDLPAALGKHVRLEVR